MKKPNSSQLTAAAIGISFVAGILSAFSRRAEVNEAVDKAVTDRLGPVPPTNA